jgi:hypothetical protein
MAFWSAKQSFQPKTSKSRSQNCRRNLHRLCRRCFGSESYVKIGGVTCERVTSWKLQIDNSCKAVPVIRSVNGHLAKYLTWGKRLLTGELTFEFESKQEADDILADVEQSSLEFGLGGATK